MVSQRIVAYGRSKITISFRGKRSDMMVLRPVLPLPGSNSTISKTKTLSLRWFFALLWRNCKKVDHNYHEKNGFAMVFTKKEKEPGTRTQMSGSFLFTL